MPHKIPRSGKAFRRGFASREFGAGPSRGAIREIENPALSEANITDPSTACHLPTGVQTTLISAYDSNGNYHQAFALAAPERGRRLAARAASLRDRAGLKFFVSDHVAAPLGAPFAS